MDYNGRDEKEAQEAQEAQEEFPLYTERIIINPKVKYKKLFSFLKFLGGAVIFGVIACAVIVLLYPYFDKKVNGNNEPAVSLELKKDQYIDDSVDGSLDNVRQDQADTDRLEIKSTAQINEEASKCMVIFENDSSQNTGMNDSVGLIIGDINNAYIIIADSCVLNNYDMAVKAGFNGGAYGEAKLIGSDSYSKVSLLSVQKDSIKAASDADIQVAVLGNSYKMKENDPVIAIGRINGSTGQTKFGNITQITDESSVDNTFEMMSIDIIPSYGDYCYIFNKGGNVVGIARPSGDMMKFQAVGLSDLKPLIETLSASPEIIYLGIKSTNVTSVTAERYKLPLGVYITDVIMDSPAFEAGLQCGDIITALNGNSVLTIQSFSEKLYRCVNGENITLTVKRAGRDEYRELNFSVVLSVR